MATSILLLDCSEELAKRLETLGFDVHRGRSGYCGGNEFLPYPLYEVDVVLYNPSKVVPHGKSRTLEPDSDSPVIDFSDKARARHLGQGGHWLVFVNQITDNSALQPWAYSFVPGFPRMMFTQDSKFTLARSLADQRFMDPYVPLFDSPRSLVIQKPVRVKLDPDADNLTPIIVNKEGAVLAGQVWSNMGHLTFLPTFNSNDEAAVFFMIHVWPKVDKKQARGGIPEGFQTQLEADLQAEENRIFTDYKAVEDRFNINREKLALAIREKLKVIEADPTARQILGYYGEAEEDQKDAPKHLYKVRDAIKIKFGGEAPAKAALGGCNAEWKSIGLLTNGPDRDERHPPELGQAVKPLTPEELRNCFEAAKNLILAYFKTLFPQLAPSTLAAPPPPAAPPRS